jgi:hypothetical protein
MLFETDSQGRLLRIGNTPTLGAALDAAKQQRAAFQAACETFLAALPPEYRAQVHALAEAEGVPDFAVLPLAIDRLSLSHA